MCRCTAVVAAAAAAVRHRVPYAKWPKFVDDSLNLIPVFSFSSFKHDSCTPWQYCRTDGLYSLIPGTIVVHLRQLRVCAEPSRASARHGKAPIIPLTIFSVRKLDGPLAIPIITIGVPVPFPFYCRQRFLAAPQFHRLGR